jgi:hypothetical protein
MNALNANNPRSKVRQLTEVFGRLGRSWRPESILFGVMVCYFVIELIFVISFSQDNVFASSTGWNPFVAMTPPFLLLIASVLLLVNQSWSSVFAFLLGGTIVYSNVYIGLLGISHAHGIGLFSVDALRIWVVTMSGRQITNTAFGLTVLILSVVSLYILRIRNRSMTKVDQI